MYTLTGVSKTFRARGSTVTAVRDLNLSIADGEWLAIQGRTGSGKSTLLQLLGGMDRPSTGTVNLDGQDLATMSEKQLTEIRAARVGFVFQMFNLIPTLSAIENVEAALVPLRTPAVQRRERAAAALAAVGLADRAGHLPSELSGGQQQRVGIARALVKEPSVLLADEPTGNLDVDTRDEILTLLEQIWTANQLTLVLVTHDSAVAALAERVAVMHDGKLDITGTRIG
ncbi:ABC-type antimicrobial peptide transport system, ATPase component [Frankia casuarinae]|jgi:putative ABC transport system ATP-binding protein|uniref:ABC transporter related n=1 Tax=Frankia casuarinae (strain DSM 45818 / CECT 9043 / HFP020203 / CcI3) TaxID=106370 RepID=Q2JA78_FRACC|nr:MULTISPECIES: ABC transporter ATP-binding protein [Frankia]ABD11814.1 ABC transporter related [Frankia casuarinae]ETA03347.1 ABC-type antimicrobial peptide transport system, ATPase component [Frankia sp. CcI6]EYT93558.1 ABC-type antimicrobial peptide transport system, ATPase component [Frankia casuarinae]KEZ34408.1 ABC-type antimicrobial peptide transport system, ATPase component [Frankia sp. CeD]KFB04191.1 ABC-type antimicrobial peptide transport system, ATPase component [Frankia sp. Allo2